MWLSVRVAILILADEAGNSVNLSYPGGVCWLQARDMVLGTQIVAFARAHLQLHPPDDLDLASQVAYGWRNWPTFPLNSDPPSPLKKGGEFFRINSA